MEIIVVPIAAGPKLTAAEEEMVGGSPMPLKSSRRRVILQVLFPRPLDGSSRSILGRVFFDMRTLVLIDGQNLFHVVGDRLWIAPMSLLWATKPA